MISSKTESTQSENYSEKIKSNVSRYRYRILALLFMATTINYMDRSIMGVLAPVLQDKVFHWTNSQYGYITMAFMFAYAIGYLVMGGFIDKTGTKKGYTISISIWAIFSLLHAGVTKAMGWVGFAVVRFGLGIGEGGNFPACIKTVAEWFPKRDRAWATGIFNAGTNVGATLMPIIIPLFVLDNGRNWEFSFFITFGLSCIWVFLWWRTYQKPENHPKVTKKELDYINSDSEDETTQELPWRSVFPHKETLAIVIAKLTDAAWWFYLFWGGLFLHDEFGLSLSQLALPLIIIYVMADVGSLFGGWLSSTFIRMGWSINKSRKIAMLICAIIILPVIFAAQTQIQWLSVVLIGLAAAGHQAWSANLFTIISDVFPKKATASVTGIGGLSGSAASIVAFFFLGHILDHAGNLGFFYAFLIAGSLYLVCLLILHLIMPKMRPLNENMQYISREKAIRLEKD
jgi:ACS family hexuronate transporter-like MFS transporter